MNNKPILGWMLAGLVVAGLWNGCGDRSPIDPGSGDPADRDGGFVPDPEVYAAAFDSDRLVEVSTSGGRTAEVPVNQIILLMNEGTPRATVDRLVAGLAGSIVGQIPDIDFYQVEVPTATVAELDAVIDQAAADSDVTSAGYNALARLSQSCPAQNDNADIDRADQCAFAETEYYQAITMFDIFRPHLLLHRARVGVVDTGLDPSTGQFDDVDILYLNSLAGPPEDPHHSRHGTAVCGIIAADDDFSSINGIASRFLGDNLRLIVGGVRDAASILVYTTMAASAGADVINISLGWEASHERFEVMWHTWLRLMGRRGDVLFVCSAGNEALSLNGFNYAPGSIGLPNVITVGGTDRCNPDEQWPLTNHGSAVDIAAPASGVPVVDAGGGYTTGMGTSFSAPIVTSLAAILKSINPSLSPQQIKRQITSFGFPMADNTDFGRVVFTTTICEALLEANVGDPVESWIDPMGLGNAGASGLILARICPPSVSFNVDGYGSHDVEVVGEELGGTLFADGPVVPWSVNGYDDQASLRLLGDDFSLGTHIIYPADESGENTAAAVFYDHDSLDFGGGIAGSVTFDSCRIEQRDPWDGITPWIIRASGAFEGVLEVSHLDGRPRSYHSFTGYFSVPMLVGSGMSEEDIQYLETNCEGGIPRPSSEP